MKILALEFSSTQRSVAVANGDGQPIEIIETGDNRTQAFAMIEAALREAKLEREQIECIVIGLGPGSYTGIRAALSIAQGWQLGREVKLLGISSVEAIAEEARAQEVYGCVNVIVDAQRNELYRAIYTISADRCDEMSPLRILARSEILTPPGVEEEFVGPEVTRWFDSGKVLFPRAAMLVQMAGKRTDFRPGETIEPIYLRETNFVKAPPLRIIS
jgi:tRNA threonylcarbamoyl adenosine modification protein YeaZ